jgi:hypothetical protein
MQRTAKVNTRAWNLDVFTQEGINLKIFCFLSDFFALLLKLANFVVSFEVLRPSLLNRGIPCTIIKVILFLKLYLEQEMQRTAKSNTRAWNLDVFTREGLNL